MSLFGVGIKERDFSLLVHVSSNTFYQGEQIEATVILRNESGRAFAFKKGMVYFRPDAPYVHTNSFLWPQFFRINQTKETPMTIESHGNHSSKGERQLVVRVRIRVGGRYIRITSPPTTINII